MNSQFEYAAVLLCCVAIPALLYFHPNYPLKGKMKLVFASIIIAGLPYIAWDIWATSSKHWAFNQNYHSNFFIFNLPFEEVMFFVAIPFCTTFTWSLISSYNSWKDIYKKLLTLK
jgi:lycopene cyclase domain-containing protein